MLAAVDQHSVLAVTLTFFILSFLVLSLALQVLLSLHSGACGQVVLRRQVVTNIDSAFDPTFPSAMRSTSGSMGHHGIVQAGALVCWRR